MADDEAIAVRDAHAGDGVAVFDGDGGSCEGAEVEEDADFGGREEFAEEMDVDGRGHVTGFVEEDAEAWLGNWSQRESRREGMVVRGKRGLKNTSDAGEFTAAESMCKLKMAVFALGDEAGGEESIRSFGSPLLFLTETP